MNKLDESESKTVGLGYWQRVPVLHTSELRLDTFLQAFDLAHAQTKESDGSGTRHVCLDACIDNARALQFPLDSNVNVSCLIG